MRAGMTIIVAALVLAACTTSNTIDGHQVRSIADSYGQVDAETAAMGDTLGLDAQAAMEAYLDALAEEQGVSSVLHAGAPQWFRDGWRRYLRDADGRYAVLAVDRNARGWGYVYCRAADCHRLEGAGNRSFKDLRYKHKARELCRGNVREYQPAHRPDCAIYAIKDKVVWKGRMPWE